MNLFHRIEKWNGRHYQPGALWQVGLKIHTRHNGSPCPHGHSALSELKQQISTNQNIAGNILEEVAIQFGKTEAEIVALISEALEHPVFLMNPVEQEVLTAIAEKSGRPVRGRMDPRVPRIVLVWHHLPRPPIYGKHSIIVL